MSARPPAWRTALLLLIMVAFLLGAGWFGLKSLISPLKPDTTPCEASTITGALTSDQVTVRVYNGGTKRGLASSLQTKLKAVGFYVPTIGNTQDTVLQTTIKGATDTSPEVLLVAAFFPDSVIVSDNRTDHSVDVLVGDTFGDFNDQAPTSITVQSAVICNQAGRPSTVAVPPPTTAAPPPDTSTPSSGQ